MATWVEYPLRLPDPGTITNAQEPYTLRIAHLSLASSLTDFTSLLRSIDTNADCFVLDARWIPHHLVLQAASLKALNDKFSSKSMRVDSLPEQVKYNISPQKGATRGEPILAPEEDTTRIVLASLLPTNHDRPVVDLQRVIGADPRVVTELNVQDLAREDSTSVEFVKSRFKIGEKEAALGELWKAVLRRVATKEC